jgi:uncharacterized protein (DUF4415 family)
MRAPKRFVSIRIDQALFERWKSMLKEQGKQQTVVATRLIEGWLKGKFEV